MTRSATTTTRKPPRGRIPQGVARVLICTVLGSSGLVTTVLTTASGSDAPLGAPAYWSWVLTGLQVAALWAAGTGRSWGWPLGTAVQPAWIAYALVTGQVGFIPGCMVSGTVQTVNFVREARRRRDAGRTAPTSVAARLRPSSTGPRTLARFDS
jgi:hypothetical protein